MDMQVETTDSESKTTNTECAAADETPVTVFLCNKLRCAKSFLSKQLLEGHIRSHHGSAAEPVKYPCNQCGSDLSSQRALEEHLRIHSNTKPYECDVCKMMFRQFASYSKHLRRHSDERPYQCTVCQKNFKQKQYLKSHMLSHTKERNFPCSVCGKNFRSRSDVNRHEIIHSGVKPYLCTRCGMGFADGSTMRRHISKYCDKDKKRKRAKQIVNRDLFCRFCSISFHTIEEFKKHLNSAHHESISEVTVLPNGNLELIYAEGDSVVVEVHSDQVQSQVNARTEFLQSNTVSVSPATNGEIDVTTAYQESECKEIILYMENENTDDGDGLTGALNSTNHGLGKADNTTAPTDAQHSVDRPTSSSIHRDSKSTVTDDHVHHNEVVSNVGTADRIQEAFASRYIDKPDFTSQEFFDWLANFIDLCLLIAMPLSISMFSKINQLEKHIVNTLAYPTSFMTERRNFQSLMAIGNQLKGVLNAHLNHVMLSLEEDNSGNL